MTQSKPAHTACPHSFISNVGGKYRPGDGICCQCDAEIIKPAKAAVTDPALEAARAITAWFEQEATRRIGLGNSANRLRVEEFIREAYGPMLASHQALKDALRAIVESKTCSDFDEVMLVDTTAIEAAVRALALAEEEQP